MGDYTPVPDQSANQTTTASSSADPVILADSASQPVQANSPPVVLPTQTDSLIPTDSSAEASAKVDSTLEATASASSAVQPPASDVPSVVVPVSNTPVSPPISEQPEVVPEQVIEASASATVSTQENTPNASDSFVENPQQNLPESPSVQPPQNTSETPVISIGQSPSKTAPQSVTQPIFQPVEATAQPSIDEPSLVKPPIQVQQDAPTNTPSVPSAPSGQTQQESAGIKPEPLQPIQNVQTSTQNSQELPKSSFGELMGGKTDGADIPTINIEPIEAPVVVKSEEQSQSQFTDNSEKQAFAIRRQHAVEARKQKYAENLDKIIELVQKKGNVDNLDVRDFLHVSQTTATDYLHTLVSSGKLKKDGKAKATVYSLF